MSNATYSVMQRLADRRNKAEKKQPFSLGIFQGYSSFRGSLVIAKPDGGNVLIPIKNSVSNVPVKGAVLLSQPSRGLPYLIKDVN